MCPLCQSVMTRFIPTCVLQDSVEWEHGFVAELLSWDHGNFEHEPIEACGT